MRERKRELIGFSLYPRGKKGRRCVCVLPRGDIFTRERQISSEDLEVGARARLAEVIAWESAGVLLGVVGNAG